MKITILGSGTSHGVPVLGCHCDVCKSTDKRDKRTRSSILFKKNGKNLVIDTGYEFRTQLLREGIDNIDAVLYTHTHADHISGLDDLRVFSQKNDLCIYGNKQTIKYIKQRWPYACRSSETNSFRLFCSAVLKQLGFRREAAFVRGFPGVPHIRPIYIPPYKAVDIVGFKVVPLVIEHGRETHWNIYGYRVDDFAYITDCTYITAESYKALEGVKGLVIGGLRKRPHGAHFSFEEAYEVGRKLGLEKFYFTHINHESSAREIDNLYPEAFSAYDGMTLEV
ncbi:MAG: MBL fold metallo-hydrolase [Sphaerochaetaceae bacterium]|nr:MBL fold metallo-hydrolase [Sphaerochaetaceae bacterium]